MTLPIQTIINTHEALSDWKFTAQEANQVIASVGEGVMGAIMITAMMGMFYKAVSKNPDGEPSNPKRLSASNPRIEQARFTRKTMDALDELTSAVAKRPVDNAAELDEALTLWIKQEKGLNNLARLAKESDDYLPRLHSILREQYGDEITVYRGGQSTRQIVSVSTDRDIAARFGDVEQFTVRTSNILAACPTLESELLVRQAALMRKAKSGNTGSVKLYHCTAAENVSGIMKDGLLSFESEMLFFFPSLATAEKTQMTDWAILEVSITDDEVDKCTVGEMFPDLYFEQYGKDPPADTTLREYIRNPVAYLIPEVCCTVSKIPANRIKYVKTIRR